MGLSWTSIVNTAKHAVTVTETDVSKIVGEAGKIANSAIKLFIKVEPVAVTALAPFFPQGSAILGTAYTIAEKVESDLTATGATKLAMASGILTDAVIPTVEVGLNAAGKTIDQTKVALVVPDLFGAIVAENNAQSQVATILQTAETNKTLPDAAALAAAEQAVASAVATVKTLGVAIQSAISSIAPVTAPTATATA